MNFLIDDEMKESYELELIENALGLRSINSKNKNQFLFRPSKTDPVLYFSQKII